MARVRPLAPHRSQQLKKWFQTPWAIDMASNDRTKIGLGQQSGFPCQARTLKTCTVDVGHLVSGICKDPFESVNLLGSWLVTFSRMEGGPGCRMLRPHVLDQNELIGRRRNKGTIIGLRLKIV